MSLYLKWTRKGRIPSYQGGKPIPYRKWTPTRPPVLCRSGWHACRWGDAARHISDELWIVELDGYIVEGDDKVAAERLRIVRRVSGVNERTLRLFAADCAESVLHLFEQERPSDDRPRRAVQAARDFAEGRIGAAASAAASDAASDAAWAAAWAAEAAASDAARAARAAASAAEAAARAAASDAASAAARAAASDAARAAASDAARAAAWAAEAAADADAARAAASAARTTILLVNYGGLARSDFA